MQTQASLSETPKTIVIASPTITPSCTSSGESKKLILPIPNALAFNQQTPSNTTDEIIILGTPLTRAMRENDNYRRIGQLWNANKTSGPSSTSSFSSSSSTSENSHTEEIIEIERSSQDESNPKIQLNKKNSYIVITYNPDEPRSEKQKTTNAAKVKIVINISLGSLKVINSVAVVRFSLEATTKLLNNNTAVKLGLITLTSAMSSNAMVCLNSRFATILDDKPLKDANISNYSTPKKIGYYFCKSMAHAAIVTNFVTGVLGGKVFVDMITPGWDNKTAEIIKTVISGILGAANAKAYQKFQIRDIPLNYDRLFGTHTLPSKERNYWSRIRNFFAGTMTSLITVSFSAITFFQVVSTIENLINNILNWSDSQNNAADYNTLTSIISAVVTLPLVVATILSQSIKTYDLLESPLSVLPRKREIASIKTLAGGLTFSGLFLFGAADLLFYSFGQYAAGIIMASRMGFSASATWVKAAAWALVVAPRAVTSLAFDQAYVWKMFYESRHPRLHRHIVISIPTDAPAIQSAKADFKKNLTADPTKPAQILLTYELNGKGKYVWHISGETGEGDILLNKAIAEDSPLGKLLKDKNLSNINTIADKLLDPLMLHLNIIQSHNRAGGFIDKAFSQFSCCFNPKPIKTHATNTDPLLGTSNNLSINADEDDLGRESIPTKPSKRCCFFAKHANRHSGYDSIGSPEKIDKKSAKDHRCRAMHRCTIL